MTWSPKVGSYALKNIAVHDLRHRILLSAEYALIRRWRA